MRHTPICAECQRLLTLESVALDANNNIQYSVQPCGHCLNASYQVGYQEGEAAMRKAVRMSLEKREEKPPENLDPNHFKPLNK